MEDSGAEIRVKHVTFRLLPDEKQRLDEYVRAHDVGISDLLREVLAPIISAQAKAGTEASVAVR